MKSGRSWLYESTAAAHRKWTLGLVPKTSKGRGKGRRGVDCVRVSKLPTTFEDTWGSQLCAERLGRKKRL